MTSLSSKYPRVRITRLYKLMLLSMARTFRTCGLSITNEQEIILRALDRYGQLTQTELASLIGQDKNNLSRTIGILEKKGYVVKTACAADKRYCEISLSEQGKAVHEQVDVVLEEWRYNILFHGIEIKELEQFAMTLEKIMQNFERQLEKTENTTKLPDEDHHVDSIK